MKKFIFLMAAVLLISGCAGGSRIGGYSSTVNGETTVYKSFATSSQEVAFEMAMQVADNKNFNFCQIENMAELKTFENKNCWHKTVSAFKVNQHRDFEESIIEEFFKKFPQYK